jgi:glutamyl/glutaminyl-tRNA synthetase
MVINHQGKPYSKRDGSAFVGEFREQGYLPEALFNFLALLGWSPGDDREVLSRTELIDLFTLDRVKSHPAQFDLRKLLWMNGEYIRGQAPETFRGHFLRETRAAGYAVDNCDAAFLDDLIAQIQPRTKLYAEIAPATQYFFTEEFPYDAKAVRKRLLKDGVIELLQQAALRLRDVAEFDTATLEEDLRAFCEERGESFSVLVHPLRVAVSGRSEGPGLFEILALLGRERVLARIQHTVSLLQSGSLGE